MDGPYQIRVAPRLAERSGKARGWAMWEMAFWLRSRIAQLFGPPRLAAVAPDQNWAAFYNRERHPGLTGKAVSYTAPRTNSPERSGPRDPWRGGWGESRAVCTSFAALLAVTLQSLPPPSHPLGLWCCCFASLPLFVSLGFPFSSILTIKGALPPLLDRRGSGQPRFDARVSLCVGALASSCFWF